MGKIRCEFGVLFILLSNLLSAQPQVSFTFDDGITRDRSGYAFEVWNAMLLDHLDKANVKAIFFVAGQGKNTEKGRYLLTEWNDRGHGIANHTYSHPNLNSENVTVLDFKKDIQRADQLIEGYSNYVKLFRFPYLKEGNTMEKVKGLRTFLQEQGYRNGYVTIDASDWYIDSRLRSRLAEDKNANLEAYRDFYIEHLLDRAKFYEKLSFQLTGRHIKHTLLLHHNLAAALFLGDLIQAFKAEGWDIISASEAYQDEIFNRTPSYAGESLIWALAKDSGQFQAILRYPAEDSRYEIERMDELGL